MKDILRKYYPVITLVILILFAVSLKYSSDSSFKPDAEKLGFMSLSGEFILDRNEVESRINEFALFQIGDVSGDLNLRGSYNYKLNPDDVMLQETIESFKNVSGPSVLISNDISLSVRCWVLLSQRGIKDIYILSPSGDNEVFKYEFRPTKHEVL